MIISTTTKITINKMNIFENKRTALISDIFQNLYHQNVPVL